MVQQTIPILEIKSQFFKRENISTHFE